MIRRFVMLAVVGISLLAVSAGIAAGGGGKGPAARAVLRDGDGQKVGSVELTPSRGGVRVRVEVRHLSPGFHGFHVHTVGECISPFTSAAGHYNPGTVGHPGHAADMPVLLVNADGTGEARFVSDRYTVAEVVGRALIVHAGPDNYANIPGRYSAAGVPGPDTATLATGDSGARTACGVITGVGRDD
jgi:superoxide dismutase, Cu-Zn family